MTDTLAGSAPNPGVTMTEFLTYLFAGIALGATYALVGSGFVVVHRVTGVVNFAQGSFAVLAALTVSSLLELGLPHGLAEVLAVGVGGLAGLFVGVVTIGIRTVHTGAALVITLGLSVLFYAIAILIWGDAPRSFEGLPGTVQVLGVAVQTQYLLVIALSGATLVGLALFFSRSYVGKALTASASNPTAAYLVGIDVRRMGLLAFLIAGVLGGIAGVLIAPLSSVAYDSDIAFVLTGFAAAVFGGLHSPAKAVIGGLVLGIAGMFFAGYVNPLYQLDIALVAMLIIMIVRGRRLIGGESR